MIAREQEQIKAFDRYSPIIETYIQEVKADPQLGRVPGSDYYFLGQPILMGGSRFTLPLNVAGKGR